jgi:23S rRNA (uracil1939-C5)-methyltransferase
VSKTFEITIERLVYGGAGLGRREGKVVFVSFSVPDDHLLVQPVEEKKQFTRAETIRILKPGPGRILPVCPHFMKCGGCHWQQLEYSRQVEAKRQILEEAFYHRFPQTRDLPIVMKACPQPFGYRSRARIQLRGQDARSAIGFFRCGSHAIENVESCPLLRPSLNKALRAVRNFKLEIDGGSETQAMDIACSEEEDAWAAVRIGSSNREETLLHRSIGEFRYSFTAPVFFQANDYIIAELVSLVRMLSKNAGCGSVVDLFAGAGLFTLPLALQFQEITAVESSQAACRLCSMNLSEARLHNAQVICSDVLQWMKSAGFRARPDLVLLDPPRTGAGIEVMEQIREWAPKTIIYVSCDPQTLCRDIAKISASYKIDWIEGLDMFPQTFHFETVVRLVKQ